MPTYLPRDVVEGRSHVAQVRDGEHGLQHPALLPVRRSGRTEKPRPEEHSDCPVRRKRVNESSSDIWTRAPHDWAMLSLTNMSLSWSLLRLSLSLSLYISSSTRHSLHRNPRRHLHLHVPRALGAAKTRIRHRQPNNPRPGRRVRVPGPHSTTHRRRRRRRRR